MRSLLLAIAVIMGLGAGWMHGRVIERRAAFPKDLDVLYVPPPHHLERMSLGYREALADLVWIRGLIFAGERLEEGDLEATTRYTEAVTGLSPRFHRAYLWGGITNVYGGSKHITREMVDRAIALYRRGLEQFPESHQLLYPFGMLLMHQVGSTPGYTEAEKKALAAEGIEHIRKAAAFGADPLVRQYAATLVSDHAGEQLAIQFLESQLAQAEHEDYRRMLKHKLAALGGDHDVANIERIRREFTEELARNFAYLPDALYAVVRSESPGR